MFKIEKQKGFTLIELMIVIAIIGILAAVAIPSYQNFTKRARASEAKVMLDSIRTTNEQYHSENNTYAATLASLGDPTANAVYYTYSVVGGTTMTATATSNTTGIAAGLLGTWTLTNAGTLGGTAVSSGNNF